MARAVVTALLLVSVTMGARAQDQCVVNSGFTTGRASTVGVAFGSDVAPDIVQSAIEMWSTCDEYATGFPSFMAGGNGDFNVSVVFAESGSSAGCGVFQGVVNNSNQITGGTITLFGVDVNGN